MEELRELSKDRASFFLMIEEQQWMKMIYDADWDNNEKLNFIRVWFARTTGKDKDFAPLKIQEENDTFEIQLKLQL